MSTCPKGDPRVNAAAEYLNNLDSETRTLVTMIELAEAGDLTPGYLKLGSGEDDDPYVKANELVKRLSGGTIEDLEGLEKADPIHKRIYQDALTSAVESLYKAANNPEVILEQAAYSSRLVHHLKMTVAASSGRLLLQKIVNAPLRLFGNPESVEFVANRPTVLQEHPVSSRVYHLMSKITNFVDSYNNLPMKTVQKLLDAVGDNEVFKRNGINRELFNKLFPMFDQQTVDNLGTRFKASMVDNFRANGVDIQEHEVDAVYKEFMNIRDVTWYQINYGYSKADFDNMIKNSTSQGNENQKAYELAAPGSIIGNHKALKAALLELYKEAGDSIEGWENQRHIDAINEVIADLQDSVVRLGYVPGKIDENGEIINNPTKSLINKSNFIEHRSDGSYFSGEGDFVNGALVAIGGNGVMFDEASRIIGYNTIKKSVDDNPEWFRANSNRRTVYHGIKAWLHDQRVIINSVDENETQAARSLKRISAITGLIPAAILMNPGSSVNNLLAGHLNMLWSFGNESKMGRFLSDAEEGRAVAGLVLDHVNKFMVSPGMTSEFNMFSPPGATKNVVQQASDFMMKVSDKAGEGIVGFIPGMRDSTFVKNMLTIKGSEESMRRHIGGLIYNRVIDVLGTDGISLLSKTSLSDDDSKLLASVISRQEEKAMYDVMQALGDFNPTSKPFWTHTLGDTAKTAPLALAGAVGKLLYVFRHPMVVTFENYASSMFRNIETLKSKEVLANMSPASRKALDFSAGAGIVGFLMAVYEFMRDAVLVDKPSLQVSLTETFNPFQLTRGGGYLLYASVVAPILGTPVSEEAHREIVASNVAFALNMIGGKGIGQAIKEDHSSAEYLQSFKKIVDLPELLLDVMTNPEVTHGNSSRLFETRTELRRATTGLTSLDPIWWIERAIEFQFIRDPNNPDSVNQKYQVDTVRNSLASAFGLSVWRNNPDMVRRTRMNTYYQYESGRRHQEYYRKSGGRAGRVYNTASASQLEALRRYGKIYAPKPQNAVPVMR